MAGPRWEKGEGDRWSTYLLGDLGMREMCAQERRGERSSVMGEGDLFEKGVSGRRKTMNHRNDNSCRDEGRERVDTQESELCF